MKDAPCAICTHELCTVKECKTFLGFEMNRLPAQFLEDLRARINLPQVMHLTLTNQRKRQVSQWCKVSRRPKRTHLIDPRQDTLVEHRDQPVDCFQLHSRVSKRKCLGFQE